MKHKVRRDKSRGETGSLRKKLRKQVRRRKTAKETDEEQGVLWSQPQAKKVMQFLAHLQSCYHHREVINHWRQATKDRTESTKRTTVNVSRASRQKLLLKSNNLKAAEALSHCEQQDKNTELLALNSDRIICYHLHLQT